VAKLDVRATVTAPNEISVRLVREDHQQVRGIFRVCFEVSLSLFSTMVGFGLSLAKLDTLHWLILGVIGVSMVVFLVLASRFGREGAKAVSQGGPP
jgi:hypothetical protein